MKIHAKLSPETNDGSSETPYELQCGSLPAPGKKVGMPVSITQEASSPCGNRKVMNADATHVAEGVFHPAESASTHT
jgi:hypothetical protein